MLKNEWQARQSQFGHRVAQMVFGTAERVQWRLSDIDALPQLMRRLQHVQAMAGQSPYRY